MILPTYLRAVCILLTLSSTFALAVPILDVPALDVSALNTSVLERSPTLQEACQAPKTSSVDPLLGCPRGTVFVSQTHPAAKFRTVNSALSALPDDGSTRTVLIDQGQYKEKVVVERVSPTVFAGVTSNVRDPSSNQVRIWQSTYVNQSDPHSTLHNCDTVVLGIGTGSASGSKDFKAYNVDFVQRQFFKGQEVTQYQLGPAAALCVQSSNVSFYGCSFESYQDTIYVGDGASAFFFKSIVKGMTDQLYGSGKAWFERARLLSRACGGGITAWRSNAADTTAGVFISNSTIERSPDASTLKDMTGQCYLGRPWNVYSRATYLDTYMSNIVAPDGFKIWSNKQPNFDAKLTHYAEYKSSGPGGNLKARNLKLEHILTDREASQITWKRLFGGSTPWIDEKPVQSW